MYERLKRRVYEIVECPTRKEDGRGALDYFDFFIMALIVTNVIAVMVETVRWAAEDYARPLRAFEIFSVVVFSAEYLLRLWSCTADPRYAGAVRGRIRFALTPMALIDLLAIAPFYLEFITFDLRFIRSLRLFRLFRVFKLARYSASMRTLANVLHAKKEELLVTLFVVIVMLVFSSSVMYFAENEAQPDKFDSIPASMWWGVATLTTVGYGDVYPTTPLGKVFGAVIAILGVGIFALPTGILASGFAEELRKDRERATVTLCPHCGRDINEQ
ncbi:MAG TPA: ion transporter [Pyrinomonadaceae bacterium]|nr:ion transporter [Pyrinomonadaceae bacterium]